MNERQYIYHTTQTEFFYVILTASTKCFFVLMQLILFQPYFHIISFRCAKIEIFPHRNDQFR